MPEGNCLPCKRFVVQIPVSAQCFINEYVNFTLNQSINHLSFYFFLPFKGNDKTYQRGDHGDYGVSYKYVPMFNDKQKNFDGCYKVIGTQNRMIIAQVITPNMTWFKVSIDCFLF